MTDFETAEKLAEKSGASFEDCKRALEASDGDLLDAIILLEREGKVKNGSGGNFNSNDKHSDQKQATDKEPEKQKGESFGELCGRFFRWIGRVIHHGNTNFMDVNKNDKTIITLPITALVLMVFFMFWIVIPLAVIGLFVGCRYHFRGPKAGNDSINNAMKRASESAENIKSDVKKGMGDKN